MDAFYLAEKYEMNIAGIELHAWMVQYVKDHTPANVANLLEFNTYNNAGKFPYESETFDLVYSKGVLNHFVKKDDLFRQIHTVLKPAGLFVIADWIFSYATTDSYSAALVCETKNFYELVLANTGFGGIDFRDDSALFLGYAKDLLANLFKNRKLIKKRMLKNFFS